MHFEASAGENYFISVADSASGSGDYYLFFGPDNDDLEDAEALSPLGDQVIHYSDKSASLQPGEPAYYGVLSPRLERSLWWRYDPIKDENLEVFSDGPVLVSVFEGSELSSLKELKRSQVIVDPPISWNRLRFRVLKGHTYRVRLANTGGGEGSLRIFHYSIPQNDDLINATEIMPGAEPVDVSTTLHGATTEEGEGSETSKSIWFTYTPPADQRLRIFASATGMVFSPPPIRSDTVPELSIAIGSDLGALASVTSGVPIPVVGGTRYYIRMSTTSWATDPKETAFTFRVERSIRIGSIVQSSKDRFVLNLPRVLFVGPGFAVEASTNLHDWVQVGTNVWPPNITPYLGPSTWGVTDSIHLPQRYFRLRQF